MTLPTGTISMSQVNTELSRSATATISLGESAVRTLAGVPSGAISMQNLQGKSATTITISNQNLAEVTYYPFTAEVRYRLNSNGKVYEVTTAGGAVELEQWCTPTSEAANYEVFATIVSGSLSSGPVGSWVALSSTRDWVLENTIVEESFTCEFTVQIRRIGTTTVLDTATINLTATLLG